MKPCGILLLGVLAVTAQAEEIVIRSGLVRTIPPARRSVVHIDPIELSLVKGTWQEPQAGLDGWTKIEAGSDGVFSGRPLGGGYVYTTVQSPTARTVILEASGHTMVYVNGVPRTGDPYSYGYVSLPIELKAGVNEFLFLCGRGRLAAKLIDPKAPISLDVRDATTPDIIKGEKGEAWAAVVIRNATNSTLRGLKIEASGDGKTVTTECPDVMEMAVRKVGFKAPLTPTGKLKIRLVNKGKRVDEGSLELRVRQPGQPYKRTFVSKIDGSVQYFAVNPSTRKGSGQALFLSLHGASVEAIGQAEAYSPKQWGFLVAPTNRRPYGFDWEEVGRLDALEVLELAKEMFQTAQAKTYLTGHSMGGHGTWQMGAHFPDLFAAIAPSAGWISFASYAGGVTYENPSPVEKMLQRAGSPSDTLQLKYNYASEGIYILHGDADDNVPVDQARAMRRELESFHKDFSWHEQPGANHWWDASDEAGADAVDWAPIFDMFSHHRLPYAEETRFVDFSTVSPGISSKLRWLLLEQQEHPFELSRVQLRADPVSRKFSGTTQNVARMSLDTSALIPSGSINLDIDGQKLTSIAWPRDGYLRLKKQSGVWEVAAAIDLSEKSPLRYGGFKDVFRNEFVFVYGTRGSIEDRAWAKAKARYDAETFWYRGNGSVEVVADKDFDAKKDPDRNVVLYGNETTNAAWHSLIGDGPVRVAPGNASVAGRYVSNTSTACLFVRPRPGSQIATVAVIGGTDLTGCRLTDRVPIFTSGSAIPDLLFFSPSMLEKGTAGISAAGYFGNDWGVDSGDFAYSN
ncbi:MAG: hypothetical protein BGO01_02215 [Armatimonadetes bacterium 55-13]|nr:MAG: hypothetical protein BGO01_02215 [Armatimonadetes bacterium 55-13]